MEILAKNLSSSFLQKSVTSVKHVGPTLSGRLKKLGIETVEDLLYHFPGEGRYLDRSKLRPISEVKVGEEVSVIGWVKDIQKRRGRHRNISILSVGIYDGTSYLYGVWFNQDYLAKTLKPEAEVVFSGKVLYKYGKLQINTPLFDVLGKRKDLEDTLHTARIIPLHPGTYGLSATKLRRIIKEVVDNYSNLSDPLPLELRQNYGYLEKSLALKEIHFPTAMDLCEKSRERLRFEELFLLQLGLVMRKKRLESQAPGFVHHTEGPLTSKLLANLPFELTSDQKRALVEIKEDLKKPHPMNRLLQGEVGSGKTVVALLALLMAIQSGYQGAIMAPTEVLAEQHFLKISHFLKDLPVKVALIKGSFSPKEKEKIQEKIGEGAIDLAIGTQALIQEKVVFKKLGLVIIDEQHRFGVRQRIALKEKRQGLFPDVLVMTATPIPRTLSLTFYGDLEVSTLKELPYGRKIKEHIKTVICDRRHRPWAYQKIREEVAKGRQAYIICPLIEESDKIQAKAVMEEAKYLMEKVFLKLRVAFLHSRLKSEDKEKIMADFREGFRDILISTTVVEVGVDIPKATVMVVEDAERFGLSQLHQLRGRIGRGQDKSYFILFADPSTEEGKSRMKAIQSLSDGFQLAEKDLEIRGEGELFGPRQSGLPDLKLAKLSRDLEVLMRARQEALVLLEKDPYLKEPEHELLLLEVKKKFAAQLDWLFHS